MKNEEIKLEGFLNELLSNRKPDYSDFNGNEELIKMLELSLLLKKEKASFRESFKNELGDALKTELVKKSKRAKNNSKRFAFSVVSFAAVLSMFFMLFKPVGNVYAPLKLAELNNDKQEVVKESSYKLGNNKMVVLLYNKRNNAILYWPFGQFAIFQ
jgi:hypothetical protein